MNKRRQLRFWGTMLFVLIITYSLSNFIGLAGGGFDSEEILNLQNFYLIGGIFAFIIVVGFFYETASNKGDNKYGTTTAFANQGEKPHLKFFGRFTTPQLLFLSVIVFGSLFLLNTSLVGQRAYTGVQLLPQQFTETGSIIYSTLLIPGSENFGAAALAVLLVVGLGILARKYKWSEANYKLTLGLSFVVGFMVFAVGNHLLRYRASDVALIIVAIFWAIGGLITFLTGSFIPFLIMHMFNNFFIDISRFFSSDTVRLVSIVILITFTILYGIIYKGRWFGRKKGIV